MSAVVAPPQAADTLAALLTGAGWEVERETLADQAVPDGVGFRHGLSAWKGSVVIDAGWWVLGTFAGARKPTRGAWRNTAGFTVSAGGKVVWLRGMHDVGRLLQHHDPAAYVDLHGRRRAS